MTAFELARRSPAILLASATLLAIGLIGAAHASAADKPPPKISTHYRAEVGAQQPRRTIVLDGVRVTYTDTGGSGLVLICMHAIGHGARDFEDLSRKLSPKYRVVAIDFPDQGNSGHDLQPASGTRYTQLLTLLIEKLKLHGVVLLGNSIRGAVAVRYTSEHPNDVRALVLCDSGGLGPPPDEKSKAAMNGLIQLFAAGTRGDPAYAAAFEKYYKTVLIEPAAFEERDRIIRSGYEIAPVLLQAWQSFERPEESLWDVLPQVRQPVLLAWAKDDYIISLKGNEAAFARFPNARLEVFRGGHAAFLEDPDRFEAKLREFLSTFH